MSTLGALLATCVAAVAHAQDDAPAPAVERTSSLGWVRLPGAEQCIGPQALAEQVEARLGRSVFVPASSADLSVEGRVERVAEPAGWRATIVVSDRAGTPLGERAVPAAGDDCHALDDALVLVIALTIDPDAESRPRTPATPTPAERVVERVVTVEVPRHDPPGWRGDVTGGVVGAAGLLPSPALGFAGTVVVDPPWRWPVELESQLVFGDSVSLPTLASTMGQTPSARFASLSLGALICAPILERSHLRFAPCIGGHVVGTRVDVQNASVVGDDQRYGIDIAARARLLWRIVGPLVARIAWTFVVPAGHQTWSAQTTGGSTTATALDPDAVGMTLDLSLGLSLGDAP